MLLIMGSFLSMHVKPTRSFLCGRLSIHSSLFLSSGGFLCGGGSSFFRLDLKCTRQELSK